MSALDPIEERFNLMAFPRVHREPLTKLIKNGLYYLTVSNPVSALVAFSSAASYIYSLQQVGTQGYDTTMKVLLGYVDKLQEETKNIQGGMKEKTKEEKDDWEAECEALGCEEDPSKNKLTFADVIGMEKEKEMIFSSIVYPIVYPNLYTKTAKGVLLYGPPGTGKTYLLKAAIKELSTKFEKQVGVHFFPLTGADLKGKYVGETEKKIVRAYTCAARRACQTTDVFNLSGPKKCRTTKDVVDRLKAEYDEKGPKMFWKDQKQYISVIFIDEFDAIGGDRSKDETGMVANAVNTLLQMMDGVNPFTNIITVCATNYPWNLDAALIRRFSSQIYCNVPNYSDVVALVRYDMKSRLKFIEDNKQSYCATKVTKVFNPSDEIKSLFPSVESRADGNKTLEKYYKDQEEKRIKERDIQLASLFDTSYIKDSSNEMISLFSKMTEDKYSNSDITQMMQLAFNSVSASALSQSTWIQFSFPDKITQETYTFYAPAKLTKFNPKNEYQNKLIQSLKELENEASVDTVYPGQLANFTPLRRLQIYVDEALSSFGAFLSSLISDFDFQKFSLTEQSLQEKTVMKETTAIRTFYALYFLELALQKLEEQIQIEGEKATQLELLVQQGIRALNEKTQLASFAQINEAKTQMLSAENRLPFVIYMLDNIFAFVSKVPMPNYLPAKNITQDMKRQIFENVKATFPAARTVATAPTEVQVIGDEPILPGGNVRRRRGGSLEEVDSENDNMELQVQSGGVPYLSSLWTAITSTAPYGINAPSARNEKDFTQYSNNSMLTFKNQLELNSKLTDVKTILEQLLAKVRGLGEAKAKVVMKEEFEAWKTKQKDDNILNKKEVVQLPDGIHLDKASARSVLGGPRQLYMKGEQLQKIKLPGGTIIERVQKKIPVDEKLATSVVFENRKFVNIKFLSSCPPILMFNDVTISDLFYDPVEIEIVNQNLLAARQGKPYYKDFLMSVVFSKSYDVSYRATLGNDNLFNLLKELEDVMNEIETFVGNPYNMPAGTYSIFYQVQGQNLIAYTRAGTGAVVQNTRLEGIDQYAAVESPVTKPNRNNYNNNETYEEAMKNYIDTIRIVAEEQPAIKAQILNQQFIDLLQQIDTTGFFVFEGSPIQAKWQNWSSVTDKTALLLDPKQKAYKYDKDRVNPAWEYARLILNTGIAKDKKLPYAKRVTQKLADDFPGALGDDKIGTYNTTVRNLVSEYLYYNDNIQFLTEGEKAKLEKLVTGEINDRNVDGKHEQLWNTIENIQKSFEEKEKNKDETIFELEDEKEGKKVLYFHATIKPFSPSWVAFKSSGEYGAVGGFLVETIGKGTVGLIGKIPTAISKGWNWLKSWKSDKVSSSEAEVVASQSVAARIAEAKITTSRYLLARSTAVGVAGGQDDTMFYQYIDMNRLNEELKKETAQQTLVSSAEASKQAKEKQLKDIMDKKRKEQELEMLRKKSFKELASLYKDKLPNLLATVSELIKEPPPSDVEQSSELARQYTRIQNILATRVEDLETTLERIPSAEDEDRARLQERTVILMQEIERAYDAFLRVKGESIGRVGTPVNARKKMQGGTRSKKQKKNTTRKMYARGGKPYESIEITNAQTRDPSVLTWHYLRPENRFPQKIGQAIGSAALIGAAVGFTLLALTGVGALGAAAVGAGGLLSGATAVGTTAYGAVSTATLYSVFTTLTTGALAGAVAGTANVGISYAGRRLQMTQKTSFILEDAQRFLFNDFIGMFYAFSNPEDDLNFINLMFAIVFGDNSLEVEMGREKKDALFLKNFSLLYEGLYEKALNRRVRPWYAQITEYSMLIPEDTGYINVKKVESSEVTDYKNYLCFYMDPSFISAAMKAYPSTYNFKTGDMLEKYNKDRVKFLEELAKKDEKEKGK